VAFAFMAQLKPIRIGDTLIRQYRVYNPLPQEEWEDENVPEADLTSPANYSSHTVTFHVKDDTTLHSFAEGAGVTVTLGLFAIALTTAQTAEFERSVRAESYIKTVDGSGVTESKFQLREMILTQEEVAP
jgi:hypothetical protein